MPSRLLAATEVEKSWSGWTPSGASANAWTSRTIDLKLSRLLKWSDEYAGSTREWFEPSGVPEAPLELDHLDVVARSRSAARTTLPARRRTHS